jgi:hypothetical protein
MRPSVGPRMPSSNRSFGARGARHRASSLHGALSCLVQAPPATLQATGPRRWHGLHGNTETGRSASRRRPTSLSTYMSKSQHESWGGAASTSTFTASTTSGGYVSVQPASCWPAALAAPDRGSPRWLSGDRLPRPCLGTAPWRRSNGDGNHLVRALPARACYPGPALLIRCTTTTRGAAYGGAPGRMSFGEHSHPPRSSSRRSLRSPLAQFLAAGGAGGALLYKAWQHWRQVLR